MEDKCVSVPVTSLVYRLLDTLCSCHEQNISIGGSVIMEFFISDLIGHSVRVATVSQSRSHAYVWKSPRTVQSCLHYCNIPSSCSKCLAGTSHVINTLSELDHGSRSSVSCNVRLSTNVTLDQMVQSFTVKQAKDLASTPHVDCAACNCTHTILT